MKVKEIRKIFNELPEDWDVFVSDVNNMKLDIVSIGKTFDSKGNKGFCTLSVRQEFPGAWFDVNTNEELHWIHGEPVRLEKNDVDDDIYIGYDTDFTKCICTDGAAIRKSDGAQVLVYPKLSELSDDQIEQIDDSLGGSISDSGYIGCNDVAIVMGKPVETAKPKEEKPEEDKPRPLSAEELAAHDFDSTTHCYIESIQNITIVAWPMLYGKDNPHDLSSTELLENFRIWGIEFETWWLGHDEEWIYDHDYEIEVESYAEKKAAEYLERIK